MVDFGLADVGYYYVITDCGWSLPDRTAEGTLTWNPAIFPAGYPALGDFIHGLGLGFGVYADGGILMCMTGSPEQAGSLGMYICIQLSLLPNQAGDLRLISLHRLRKGRCRDLRGVGRRSP